MAKATFDRLLRASVWVIALLGLAAIGMVIWLAVALVQMFN